MKYFKIYAFKTNKFQFLLFHSLSIESSSMYTVKPVGGCDFDTLHT